MSYWKLVLSASLVPCNSDLPVYVNCGLIKLELDRQNLSTSYECKVEKEVGGGGGGGSNQPVCSTYFLFHNKKSSSNEK